MDIIIPHELRELNRRRCDQWHDAKTDVSRAQGWDDLQWDA